MPGQILSTKLPRLLSFLKKDNNFDGFKLASWVVRNRQFRKKGKLDPEKISKLDSVGFDWDPHYTKWETGFSHCKKFVEKEGHSNFSQSFKTEDGFNLGTWYYTQTKNRESLSPERKARLDVLGIVWKTKDEE